MQGIQPTSTETFGSRTLAHSFTPMDEKQPDPLSYLIGQRQAVLDKLRKLAPELVKKLEAWDDAIEAVAAKSDAAIGEYTFYRSAADAVVDVLRKRGPMAPQDACHAVLDGNWAPGEEGRYRKVWDAIAHQLNRGAKGKILSFPGGLVGLPEHRLGKRKS